MKDFKYNRGLVLIIMVGLIASLMISFARHGVEENNRQSAQLDDEAASVKQSIAQAQAMLENLDQRIDDVQAMKREAEGLRSKVESAYEENRGTIDQVIYYVQQGADMLQKLLGDKQINK